MRFLNRVGLVVWMYVALWLGLFAMGIPIMICYGALYFLSGLGNNDSVPFVGTWLMRAAALLAVVVGAQRATRQGFGSMSAIAIAIGGLAGLIGVFLVGGVVADAWGRDVLTQLQLQSDSHIADVQSGIALLTYGIGVLLGSLVDESPTTQALAPR
jgi:hypothetical protein